MTEHEIQIRVRYAETDAMGYLHHANYAVYFELGRTELLRSQGGNYRAIEEQGLLLVVVSLTCKFRRPARYDDLLTLRTELVRMSPAKLEHKYELSRDGLLLADGETTLAMTDREGNVVRMTDYLSV